MDKSHLNRNYFISKYKIDSKQSKLLSVYTLHPSLCGYSTHISFQWWLMNGVELFEFWTKIEYLWIFFFKFHKQQSRELRFQAKPKMVFFGIGLVQELFLNFLNVVLHRFGFYSSLVCKPLLTRFVRLIDFGWLSSTISQFSTTSGFFLAIQCLTWFSYWYLMTFFLYLFVFSCWDMLTLYDDISLSTWKK